MTNFILRDAFEAARNVIEQAKHFALSERDSLRVLAAVENPPVPNAKPLAAAKVGGVALLIEAKNELVAGWYETHGALPLLDAPRSLLLPLAAVEATLNVAGGMWPEVCEQIAGLPSLRYCKPDDYYDNADVASSVLTRQSYYAMTIAEELP